MRIFGTIVILFLISACNSSQGSIPSTDAPDPGDSVMNSNQNSDDSKIDYSTPIPNEYSPKESDNQKIMGPFFLDSTNLNIMESYPIQISLFVNGSLPTPCHEFRVEVSQPDSLYQIQVKLYSVVDPDKICAQVLTPFEFSIPMGSYPTGHYSIWINGSEIGDFDS